MTEEYSGPERRSFARTISEVEEAFDRKLRDHEDREKTRIQMLIKQLETDAFPDGTAAHRLAHQAMIDAANAEKEFWNGLKADIAKKSIWGILQILTILVIAGIAAKFGLGAAVGGVLK